MERQGLRLVGVCLASVLAVLPASAGAECFPAPEGLVGWWPADNDGNDVENGNHAQLLGGAGFGTGMVRDAFTFNGEDAYVRIPNAPQLNPTQAISVGAWFKATGSWIAGNQPIVTKGYPNWEEPYYQYHLGANGNLRPTAPANFAFWVSTEAGRTMIASPENTWTIGNWYFVVGTYDGTYIRLYVNGEEAAWSTLTGAMMDYGNSVSIGRLSEGLPAGSLFLPIDVDEPFIVNRALAASEILAIYDAGAAGMCKDEDGDGYRPPEDCDETDATINPDGIELPGNFTDENCDGNLGDCDPCFIWRNHGDYVRCVSHGVEELVTSGDITEGQGDELVSSAARSDVGKKGHVPQECQ